MSNIGRFSFLERFILRKFHPRKIFFDFIGLTWSVYFLWNHQWPLALAASMLSGSIGLISVWNVDLDKMAQTPLGRMAMLHLNPANIAIQSAGVVAGVLGIWSHSTVIMMLALSIILAGHVFGWSKFDSRFRC